MPRLRPFPFFSLLLLVCAPVAFAQENTADAVDLSQAVPIEKLAAQLAAKRVVFIGETHVRYDHHLNQLALIRELHQLDPELAIGVEYFQRPLQAHLDDYVAGRIDEDEFLRSSHYFEDWGYDYRLYAPIFHFARDQRIPLVALNVPPELPPAVSKAGLDGLSGEQRNALPKDIAPADDAYRDRLREAYAAHGDSDPSSFEHFVEAQLVWDEGMAESAALYLEAHPERRMVILAGSGHLAFGAGIPKRLARRTNAAYSIVLNNSEDMEPGMADFLLLTKEKELPPAGILGARLHDENAECRISGLIPDGAAAKAGLRQGDILTAIGAQAIHASADVKRALWNKLPGDQVTVEVLRNHLLRSASSKRFEVRLAAAE